MKSSIERVVLILLCLALALSLAACSKGGDRDSGGKDVDEDGGRDQDTQVEPEDIPDPAGSFEDAAEALSGGEGGIPVLGAGGEVTEGFETTGFAAGIMSRVTVDIGEIETDGVSAFADATISAPDMEGALRDAIDGVTEEDDMNAVLSDRLPELIESAPLREFEVRLELRYVDGQWCLVPGAELANAITGGLIEARAELIRQTVEGLKGEGE